LSHPPTLFFFSPLQKKKKKEKKKWLVAVREKQFDELLGKPLSLMHPGSVQKERMLR
jgi:hypothetical protein